MNKKLHPIKLNGNWEHGYALDIHTIKSEYLGHNNFGHAIYQTKRSKIGQLLYHVKYQADESVISEIVDMVTDFTKLPTIDVIIPVPPSQKCRRFQPVIEIALAIGVRLGKLVSTDLLKKIEDTPQLKDIFDVDERKKILQRAFTLERPNTLAGKKVLLFDDIYRSGSTLFTLTALLYNEGKAQSVQVLTLTKSRSKS